MGHPIRMKQAPYLPIQHFFVVFQFLDSHGYLIHAFHLHQQKNPLKMSANFCVLIVIVVVVEVLRSTSLQHRVQIDPLIMKVSVLNYFGLY